MVANHSFLLSRVHQSIPGTSIHHLAHGNERAPVPTRRNSITSTAIAVLFLVIAASRDAKADIMTRPLQVFGQGAVACAAYSPDGTKIALTTTAEAYVHDAATGARLRVLTGHRVYVKS